MKHRTWRDMVLGISSMVILGLMGCHLSESGSNNPMATGSVAEEVTTYAQMRDGSVVVTVNGEERQINFATSDWECFLFNTWIYAEINEQIGKGQAPGVNQTMVTLQDVHFTFSNLPSAVTELIVAVKDRVPDAQEDTYTEIGRYPVSLGTVTIPVSYGDLVRYFGATHDAIWFQALGGQNGVGIQGRGYLEMQGTLPDGQTVTIGREVCFGSNPSAPLPFLMTSVNVPAPGSIEDIYEMTVDEPDTSRASAYVSGGVLMPPPPTGNGTTAVVQTPWSPPAPLEIDVPAGSVQNGIYTVGVSNDGVTTGWTCVSDPVTVTLTVTTHSMARTWNCTIPCGIDVLLVDVAFPAGTITLQPAPGSCL